MRTAALLVTLVALGAPALADPDTARRLEAEATTLAGKGSFAAAAQKFREAFGADPRPDLMCNVGVAYFKGGDWPRAHRYLNQCLSIGGALDAAFVANARKVIDSIVQKLQAGSFTPVDFAVSPATATITLDGSAFDEPLVGSRRVYLPFGSYKATIHAEGHVDHVVAIEAAKRDVVSVGVALKIQPAKQPDVQAPPDVKPPEGPAIIVQPPREPEVVRPSSTPAIVATAGTVAFGTAAVIVYVMARGAVDDAEAAVEMPDFRDERDRAKRLQKTSWVLGGLAGAGAVVSGYLWYRATRSTSTSVEVGASGGSATVSFGARF